MQLTGLGYQTIANLPKNSPQNERIDTDKALSLY